jgi:tetratricopeptide (TPR) repeat protein/CHAT domain-containing protein
VKQAILDFRILPISGQGFRVDVFGRHQAQLLATSSFDYSLSNFTEYELQLLDFDRRSPYARLERLRAFGRSLYQKLFTPEIEKVWRQHRDHSEFLTLCLRIDERARGLEALPWETLHDGDDFLAAGAKTGMSRLPLDIPPQNSLPPVPTPIKMLAFAASPLDLPNESRLDIEGEQAILLEAVNTPAGQGRIQVDFEDEAKLEILESSLEAGYQILHFTGHGISPDNGGGLLIEDADGRCRPVGVDEFLRSLEKGGGALRLVVISGCQTARTLHSGGFRDLARAIARRGVPAVLAMQFSISDMGGLKLAETFYPKLIDGKSLEIALAATRRAMLMSDDPYIQADSLAATLIASNGQCLQSAAGQNFETAPIDLDPSFYLGSLPQLGFRFYGRRREYRRLRDGLLQLNHRAAIIHGIGGIGKTALVSHAASRLKRYFRGVYTFDCSGGQLAPERVLLELHRYFEWQGVKALERFVHQSIEPEMLAQITAKLLMQWPLLLIFDNFESQLEARPEGGFRITDENQQRFLATLVKSTVAGSRFLFTSRYLFELDERLADILSLPLDDLSQPEAFNLMLRLPMLAAASPVEKRAAYETFGGHPFALGQLDKHCRTRAIDEVLREAKAIHTQLREQLAIGLNYDRLSERARELLDRFAAFRQRVPSDAVKWVLGENAPYDLETLKRTDRNALPDDLKALNDEELIALFNRILPEQRVATDVDQPICELIESGLLTPIYDDNQPRFLSVHSLVRDFCRDQQPDALWRGRLRDAAAFHTNLSRVIQSEEKTPAMVWDGEMEAFELLMEAGDFNQAANVLADIAPLMTSWGFGRIVESQYLRLLGKVGDLEEAVIRHNLAILFQNRGNYDAALDHYKRSLEIKENLGDPSGIARSLHQIGKLHHIRGDLDAALDYCQRSQKMAEDLGEPALIASSLCQVGLLHMTRGNYNAALDYYRRSLKMAEDLDDLARIADSLALIGAVYEARSDYHEALDYYQRSLKIEETLGNLAGIANSLHRIGKLHQLRGDDDTALDHYHRALKIMEDLGDLAGIASQLTLIGTLYHRHGNSDAALAHYQRSLKIEEDLGDLMGSADSLLQIGRLHRNRGQNDEAREHFQQSLEIWQELGFIAGVSRSLYQIGNLHLISGDYETALDHSRRALKMAEDLGDLGLAASCQAQIGLVMTELGRYGESFSILIEALSAFAQIQSPEAQVAVSLLINLRDKWGAPEFDTAWRNETGDDWPQATGNPDGAETA